MKDYAKVVMGLLIVIALGAGACSSNSNNKKPTSTSNKSQTTTTLQVAEKPNDESNQVASINDATSEIGMTCQSSGTTESTCQWEGKEYTLVKPASWKEDESVRKKACDQGYINSNFQILTDEAGFYFTSDFNDDLQPLSTALSGANAKTTIVTYCPQ